MSVFHPCANFPVINCKLERVCLHRLVWNNLPRIFLRWTACSITCRLTTEDAVWSISPPNRIHSVGFRLVGHSHCVTGPCGEALLVFKSLQQMVEMMRLTKMKDKETLNAICGDGESKFLLWQTCWCGSEQGNEGLYGGGRCELLSKVCDKGKVLLPTLTLHCFSSCEVEPKFKTFICHLKISLLSGWEHSVHSNASMW